VQVRKDVPWPRLQAGRDTGARPGGGRRARDDEDDGGVAGARPAGGGLLTQDGSWVRADGPALFPDLAGLQHGFDRLPSGTPLYVALVVTDVAGGGTGLDAEVTVP
jgi:hypothetical protein